DDRSLDGWITAGYILEDLARDSQKTELFKSACEAFEKAMELTDKPAGQTTPWLGRGRTRYRWAKALRSVRAPDAEVQKLLVQSNGDFSEVFDWSRSDVEKAEAYVWKGRGQDLLRNSAAAKEAFAKARDRAQESKTRLGRYWQETALYEWANLCYNEARALYP